MSPHEHGIPRAHARPTADNHFTSNLTSIQAVFDDWDHDDDGEEGVLEGL